MPESSCPAPAEVPFFLAADVLHLILMPTERCNFRCVYCYEDFTRGVMSRETIDGVLGLIGGRAPGLRQLTVEWFGGEPLLALPVVEEVQRELQRLEGQHRDLQVDAGMTTNGYLLSREVFERLVGLGVGSYQISLDGWGSAHDGLRRRADGRGTFERIWANLLAIRDTELAFKIRLRLNVEESNRRSMPRLLDLLGSDFGGDDRVEVFIRAVARLGGPGENQLHILGGERDRAIHELRQEAAKRGLRVSRVDEGGVCYAAAANSFVIRSDGEIAKCTVALRHPNNRIGQLHADGTATVDNAKIRGWTRGLFSGVEEELQCPKRGFADSYLPDSRTVTLGQSGHPVG